MQISVNKQDITITQSEKLVSDTENIYSVSYQFTSDWDGYSKTAIIAGNGSSYAIILDENLTCNIPNELLANTGKIRFGMLGTKVVDGVTKRYPTVWSAYVDVAEASAGTDTPPEPTEDVYATIIANEEALATNKQDKLTAGTGIAISENNVISSTVTSATWGSISGTLSSQTDLQSELTRIDGRCDNLQNMGRYLALWDCSTGKPTTNPTTMPYTYKAGDYYRVSTLATYEYLHSVYVVVEPQLYFTLSIGSHLSNTISTYADIKQFLVGGGYTSDGINSNIFRNISGSYYGMDINGIVYLTSYDSLYIIYNNGSSGGSYSSVQSVTDTVTTPTYYKPNGATYNDVASTTAETGNVAIGDVYFYDGTSWTLQINHSTDSYNKTEVDALVGAKSSVSVSASGTATDEIQYITVDGTEKKIGGGGSLYAHYISMVSSYYTWGQMGYFQVNTTIITSSNTAFTHDTLMNYLTNNLPNKRICASGYHCDTSSSASPIVDMHLNTSVAGIAYMYTRSGARPTEGYTSSSNATFTDTVLAI